MSRLKSKTTQATLFILGHTPAIGLEERRAVIRKLFVELQCLRPRDDDSSKRPIYEQALLFGAIVTSEEMVKQKSPAVSGISPKSQQALPEGTGGGVGQFSALQG
jgi:hypothetical protein